MACSDKREKMCSWNAACVRALTGEKNGFATCWPAACPHAMKKHSCVLVRESSFPPGAPSARPRPPNPSLPLPPHLLVVVGARVEQPDEDHPQDEHRGGQHHHELADGVEDQGLAVQRVLQGAR